MAPTVAVSVAEASVFLINSCAARAMDVSDHETENTESPNGTHPRHRIYLPTLTQLVNAIPADTRTLHPAEVLVFVPRPDDEKTTVVIKRHCSLRVPIPPTAPQSGKAAAPKILSP